MCFVWNDVINLLRSLEAESNNRSEDGSESQVMNDAALIH